MKKSLFVACALSLLTLASCSTIRKTSATLDVATTAVSRNTADLEVSPTKVSYTLYPSKAIRRGGEKNVKATAVAELLKANGNADVLVAPQFEIKKKRGIFGQVTIKHVTVTGYPATYKNFRTIEPCKP